MRREATTLRSELSESSRWPNRKRDNCGIGGQPDRDSRNWVERSVCVQRCASKSRFKSLTLSVGDVLKLRNSIRRCVPELSSVVA